MQAPNFLIFDPFFVGREVPQNAPDEFRTANYATLDSPRGRDSDRSSPGQSRLSHSSRENHIISHALHANFLTFEAIFCGKLIPTTALDEIRAASSLDDFYADFSDF
eukprot:TRINITY_DN88416_c0_g1_i1.p1 TRINITY_DN88416_c0_g1~~TRINITY_DN88416_c0_g1_i1.p1  ORF type:complete len:114 (-),score=7.52 TRINITY_DN88416_c0_g1_i1:88-408(-)